MKRFTIQRTNIVVPSKPSTIEYVWGVSYDDALINLKIAIRKAGGYATHYKFKEVK